MSALCSELLHRAILFAAAAHRDQYRKGSQIPYLSHPLSVALILARLGFDDEVLAAAVLHDVLEDTPATVEQLRQQFGARVADLVDWTSETVTDARGGKRPWEDRKRDKVAKLASAPLEAKALALADALHNAVATLHELQQDGPKVWHKFNAPPERRLAHLRALLAACQHDDPRVRRLAEECQQVLAELEAMPR